MVPNLVIKSDELLYIHKNKMILLVQIKNQKHIIQAPCANLIHSKNELSAIKK